jgi:diguanylate cyclase (GGDEF)-like protein
VKYGQGYKIDMITQKQPPDIQAKLTELQQTFATKIPKKVQEIRQSWEKLKSAPDDQAMFETFYRQVHTLTGTGATYGFEAISGFANMITLRLPKTEDITSLPVDEIEFFLEKLDNAISGESTAMTINMAPIQRQNMTFLLDNAADMLIYIVDDDVDLLSSISIKIQHFGYRVVTFSDLLSFDKALEREVPDVVIMDVIFDGGSKLGTDHIAHINTIRKHPLKTIFMSTSGDITTRLDAVRANGLAFFPKPIVVPAIVDAIATFTHQITEDIYRVIIVDDSPEQSALIALILQQAGMQTIEVNQPLQLLDVLASFQPDLVLMDLYMPDCDGMELSQIIRQMNSYANLPIVFLSTESDLKKKLGVMGHGGDDFLTKPVLPWHLASAITNRIKRGRMISKLADTDGLTGLLNHIKSKDKVESELARASRGNTSLSIAMLDLDNFKHVNDNYGHPVGDKVLKNLTNFFKQNLRPYDVIGRYGGEEFLVLLPSTDLLTAKTIMDKLRIGFSKIHHLCDEGDFTCNFSCGIASFPDFDSAITLIEAADKALYAAKNAGRNQVVINTPKINQ